ncbi:NUDIX domain-containing protein [Haloarchaeobius sp. HRN-SO-5]|uniref:NUDIX domain-containing protein n=1 Tax=Haloarchaeobius sp. HRN-SO-5 TaxID=3446118 RepID=UPI003EB778EA
MDADGPPERDDRRVIADTLRERARGMRRDACEGFETAPERDPLVTEPAHYQPQAFPRSVDEQLDRLAGSAGMVVVDDGRVLCTEIGYKDGWMTPGGAQDPGETLAETAVRETYEETNIEAEITGVFYHRDFAIDYGHDELVRVPLVVFTGRRVGGRRATPSHRVPSGEPEITDVDWFAPDELPDGLTDRERIRDHLG